MQPKGPLDACAAQSASEHVRTVWSTANICGIRSLPNALNPDFRERLYQELVAAAQRERAGDTSGDRGRRADLSYGLEGGPLAMPLSVGQKQVARIHPLSGVSWRGVCCRVGTRGWTWRHLCVCEVAGEGTCGFGRGGPSHHAWVQLRAGVGWRLRRL